MVVQNTKDGNTEKSLETKDKAEALQKRIAELNTLSREKKYFGGIVVRRNEQWYINSNAEYYFDSAHNSDWKILNWQAQRT